MSGFSEYKNCDHIFAVRCSYRTVRTAAGTAVRQKEVLYGGKRNCRKKTQTGGYAAFLEAWGTVREVDLPFFLIVIALLVMGIVMMFSASYAWAIAEGKEGSYYAVSQMKNAGLGLVLMLFLCMVDYHFFQKKLIAIGAYVLPLILLVMVFIPGIGVTDGGATRWIAIGSFNFQPSETMKIGMVIFYSYVITKNYDNMRYFLRGMLPLLLALLVPAALLIKEPHISATALIVMTCIILIFGRRCQSQAVSADRHYRCGRCPAVGFDHVPQLRLHSEAYPVMGRSVCRQSGQYMADLSVPDRHWLWRTVRSGTGGIPPEVSVPAGNQKATLYSLSSARNWGWWEHSQ